MRGRIGLLIVGGLLASATGAAAQGTPSGAARTRGDVAAGYAWLRETAPGGGSATYPRGWVASGAYSFGVDRLQLVGEAGVNARTNIVDETARLWAILGGGRVRVTTTGRLATFAQLLVGTHRFNEPGYTASGLAVQPGAGVDLSLTGPLAVRVQADYRLARENGATFKQMRVGVSAVLSR